MSEVIKFPTTPTPVSPEIAHDNIQSSAEVLEFRKRAEVGVKEGSIKACFLAGGAGISVGSEILLVVCGKKYKAIVTDIVQRDQNNNVTKIAYTVPFLNGDDPFKFGAADFKYDVQTYD